MSGVKQLDYRLTIGGVDCRTCFELEVTQSSYVECSTFRATIVLGDDPEAQQISDILDVSPAPVSAEILVTIDVLVIGSSAANAGWQRLIVGRIDYLAFDVERSVLEIEGRDLMARLVDLSSAKGFVNQTSSEIVSSLVSMAGLTANVDSTSQIVGQYYEIEHTRASLTSFSRFSNGLDIVARLAEAEGYDCWVDGSELNFVAPDGQPAIAARIDVSGRNKWGDLRGFRSLRMSRRLPLQVDGSVSVRSWNSRQRRTVESSYPAGSSGPPKFNFLAPNLTDEMALAKATSLFSQVTRHRASVSGEIVGTVSLAPRQLIEVVGSQGWDGLYGIERVTTQLNAHRGLAQHFVACPR